MREALFLMPNHTGDAADIFEQFGIGVAHALGHLLRHLEKKRLVKPEHPAVAYRPPYDLAQHVAAAFVRGHHAIAD